MQRSPSYQPVLSPPPLAACGYCSVPRARSSAERRKEETVRRELFGIRKKEPITEGNQTAGERPGVDRG